MWGLIVAYPSALPEAVEAELVGDLGGVHGVLEIVPSVHVLVRNVA